MNPEISLPHRRHRMPAHDRMAVYAEHLALVGCKQVAERGKPLQLRCADDKGDEGLIED